MINTKGKFLVEVKIEGVSSWSVTYRVKRSGWSVSDYVLTQRTADNFASQTQRFLVDVPECGDRFEFQVFGSTKVRNLGGVSKGRIYINVYVDDASIFNLR